jgi:DNA-binding CsgD family transcriptional regulator
MDTKIGYPLSRMEIQVLQGIAEGLTNKGIAASLKINEQTSKNHVASIFAKLGTKSRGEAVRVGIEKGVIDVARINWVHSQPKYGLKLVPLESVQPKMRPSLHIHIPDLEMAKISLEKHGQTVPIVVEDGVVSSGDMMWWAAQQLGWKVIVVYDMPPET